MAGGMGPLFPTESVRMAHIVAGKRVSSSLPVFQRERHNVRTFCETRPRSTPDQLTSEIAVYGADPTLYKVP